MCNCGKKKKVNGYAPNEFMVFCLGCDEPLQTSGGNKVPVHKVPVRASKRDILHWIDEGFNIQFVNSNDREKALV